MNILSSGASDVYELFVFLVPRISLVGFVSIALSDSAGAVRRSDKAIAQKRAMERTLVMFLLWVCKLWTKQRH